jgi:hypothetical protein
MEEQTMNEDMAMAHLVAIIFFTSVLLSAPFAIQAALREA